MRTGYNNNGSVKTYMTDKGYFDSTTADSVATGDCMCCEAREAGSFLAAIARTHQDTGRSLAFLAGGETVVHLTGTGKGGRNQELALAAAEGIAGLRDTAVFSVGIHRVHICASNHLRPCRTTKASSSYLSPKCL